MVHGKCGNSQRLSGRYRQVNYQWITVAYVYTSDTLKVYHNCTVKNNWGKVYPEVSDLCGTEPMQIGLGNVPQGAFQYGYRYFKGKIDELRIYTRALSDDEIKYFADTLCNEKIPVFVEPIIKVLPNPCKPNEFTFINASVVSGAVTDSAVWHINNNYFIKADSFYYHFTSTGNYPVQLYLYVGDSLYIKDTMISIASLEPLRFLQAEQTVIQACSGSSIEIVVRGGAVYNWQPCYNLNDCSSSAVKANVDSNVTYTVSATDINGCADALQIVVQKVADENRVFIPTAFTPNKDGLNDNFGVISEKPLVDFEFAIYNRWGALIFQSKDQNKKWDGIDKTIPAQSGAYVWKLIYRNLAGCLTRKLHGTVVPIR